MSHLRTAHQEDVSKYSECVSKSMFSCGFRLKKMCEINVFVWMRLFITATTILLILKTCKSDINYRGVFNLFVTNMNYPLLFD